MVKNLQNFLLLVMEIESLVSHSWFLKDSSLKTQKTLAANY